MGFYDKQLRLEFESQHARLNTCIEYEQKQLEQQRKKVQKLEDTISKEEKFMTEQRKVSLSFLCCYKAHDKHS